jgi:arylsulfate sulfotransferase
MLHFARLVFFTGLGALTLAGCKSRSANIIAEIKVGTHHNNELQVQVDVLTVEKATVFVEYWPDSAGISNKLQSSVSTAALSHALVLMNIVPATKYSYQVVTNAGDSRMVSKPYSFTTRALPLWLQDQFKYSVVDEKLIPRQLKDGFLLMNKRETPGVDYIVDYAGRLRWYHMVDGTGFKVTHFTQDNTVLSILGKNDEPTSYGSEILEINLLGDTILHLKKGTGDFTHIIHHEILKKNSNAYVTLFIDDRLMDLRSRGGSAKDTVNGDGIMILDSTGNKIWQWSVFDVLNPLDDANLLKDKKDWMHANSLNYDADSNYIVSFYNNGQIWKVDAKTGKIIWTMGKGGTVQLPAGIAFDQSHAVHINEAGDLMFFDNGVAKHQSEVFSFKVDDIKKTAAVKLHIPLPKELYNDRMGSAYRVSDATVLVCSSKRHIAVLVNNQGVILWTLNTAIPPYRVELIAADKLKPYILN